MLQDLQNMMQKNNETLDLSKPLKSSNANNDNKWNFSKINFFDSLYNDKSSLINNVIKYASKNTYFRDVHVFIERIKNIIQIKNDELIHNNFYICLKNMILT